MAKMTEIFKETSLLMKGPLVTSTLADRKTKTRRFITQRNSLIDGCVPTKRTWAELDWSKPEAIRADPGPSPSGNPGPYLHVPNVDGDCWHRVYPRVQPGTRIWVRENAYYWGHWVKNGKTRGGRQKWRAVIKPGAEVVYQAEGVPAKRLKKGESGNGWIFRPGMFMPRWACRLELDTTKVRVERLQDISYEDALSEGVADMRPMIADECRDGETADQCARRLRWPQREFQLLWESIQGPGSWAQNPWLWVIEFRRMT
jgi:hypothetical protein